MLEKIATVEAEEKVQFLMDTLDEEMIIDISKELLMRLGYMVFAVNSGEAAVATVRRKGTDIDLVLLDFMQWQLLY